jgi:hypothetical protein
MGGKSRANRQNKRNSQSRHKETGQGKIIDADKIMRNVAHSNHLKEVSHTHQSEENGLIIQTPDGTRVVLKPGHVLCPKCVERRKFIKECPACEGTLGMHWTEVQEQFPDFMPELVAELERKSFGAKSRSERPEAGQQGECGTDPDPAEG